MEPLIAIGVTAIVELHAHHIVVSPNHILSAFNRDKHFIPLSNITAVSFREPAMLAKGLIKFSVNGEAQPIIVEFARSQADAFLAVLHGVNAAIHTPSLERIALDVVQERARFGSSSDFVEFRQSPGGSGANNDHDGPEIIDAEFEEVMVPAGQPLLGYREREKKKVKKVGRLRRFWRSSSDGGRALIVTATLTFIVIIVRSCAPMVADTAPADAPSPATAASPSGDDQAAGLDNAAKQNLSDWVAFVTGDGRPEGMALVDGPGDPGAFCNAARPGAGIMGFGRVQLKNHDFQPIYNSVTIVTGHATIGVFRFDHDQQKLYLSHLRAGRLEGPPRWHDRPDSPPLDVQVPAPGIVRIGGHRFHTCVA